MFANTGPPVGTLFEICTLWVAMTLCEAALFVNAGSRDGISLEICTFSVECVDVVFDFVPTSECIHVFKKHAMTYPKNKRRIA